MLSSVLGLKLTYHYKHICVDSKAIIINYTPKRVIPNYASKVILHKAVPLLRLLISGLSPRRTRFAPGSVHAGYIMDKVALGQAFLRVLRFLPVNVITSWLSTLIYNLGDKQ
jgi:hypothetical protein